MNIVELLAFVVKNNASDLHLSAGMPLMICVHGDVRRINLPAMEYKDVHDMIYDIMNDSQRKFYEEHLECNFSFAAPNLCAFSGKCIQYSSGCSLRNCLEILNSGVNVAIFAINKRYHESTKSVKSVTRVT